MARKKAVLKTDSSGELESDGFPRSELLKKNISDIGNLAELVLIEAENCGLKDELMDRFSLSPDQIDLLLTIPKLPLVVKKKLESVNSGFSLAEVGNLAIVLAARLGKVGLKQQVQLIRLGNQLVERLVNDLNMKVKWARTQPIKTKANPGPKIVYQFKITLSDSDPPIWRRIQVEDCTINRFHEHIQLAMGWENRHLHRFVIDKRAYSHPKMKEFDEVWAGDRDTTQIKLGQLLSTVKKRIKIEYEYDFGDSWMHEIVFEGTYPKAARKRYPQCLEGEFACPPEDVGGIYGYYAFLTALADPGHMEHEDYLQWFGDFDPAYFNAAKTTREMKKGLPAWDD